MTKRNKPRGWESFAKGLDALVQGLYRIGDGLASIFELGQRVTREDLQRQRRYKIRTMSVEEALEEDWRMIEEDRKRVAPDCWPQKKQDK